MNKKGNKGNNKVNYKIATLDGPYAVAGTRFGPFLAIRKDHTPNTYEERNGTVWVVDHLPSGTRIKGGLNYQQARGYAARLRIIVESEPHLWEFNVDALPAGDHKDAIIKSARRAWEEFLLATVS